MFYSNCECVYITKTGHLQPSLWTNNFHWQT